MRIVERAAQDLHAFDQLVAVGDGAPSLEDKLELLRLLRRSRERNQQLDEFLVRHVDRLAGAIAEAQQTQHTLKQLVDSLLAPPWHPGVFLRLIADGAQPRALVMHAGGQRIVGFVEGSDPAALRAGEQIFLGKDANVIVGRAPNLMPRCGETACFERDTADGRAVLKWRDEEIVVDRADALQGVALQRGEQVRWDRAAWLALERIERADGRHFLLDDVPLVGRDRVGGQQRNLDLLLAALTGTLIAPELAARYGVGERHSILMYGPPGCGKTLLARVAAAELQRVSGRRCRFGVVKPAEWESPWVGETQQNIRRCFAALRAAAADGPAILFLDEIEAIGRIRGSAGGLHADKALAATLAEIEGFSDRSGIAIIAATNRKDLVDPALLERLSDLEIAVQRPQMDEARAIFAVHLQAGLPYSPNGAAADATRDEIIETAVSRFYSPNGGNELCTLRLRDGTTRAVCARELASGRTFEQICRAARRTAFLRHARGGAAGVRVADVEEAMADAFERLATTLSVRNAHAYLSNLPQDVDVISVEPIVRRPARPHRYLAAAGD
jgi:ATP-dependent 26S proteasome regulatory subunit